jgi:peptide/nickel transport system ATP-binding protein/oligopeptide transport system ATP-binding protein
MQKKHHVSLLLITHDLSVVAHTADTVYVMYSGKIVEKAKVEDLFNKPHHPYTEGLLGSIPRLSDSRKHFLQIPDSVPHPMFKPSGCYFHPRCRYASEQCKQSMPPLEKIDGDREIRCYHPLNTEEEDRS